MMSITHTGTETDTKSERVPYPAKLGEKIAEVGRQEESNNTVKRRTFYLKLDKLI